MFMHRLSVLALMLVVSNSFAQSGPGLGEPVSSTVLLRIDYTVLPNGDGLPDGSGNAVRGAAVYAQNCLACHGEGGVDGLNDRLVGGVDSLLTDKPVRTVGSYWPYATTLFDYIRKAMPYQMPGSLSNDDIYAVTAYILSLSDIVDDGADINARTLPKVIMPNRDTVVWDYQPGE